MFTKAVSSCLAVAVVVAVGACGSSDDNTSSSSSGASAGTVDIYSSLPLLGASTTQTKPMVNGIKLALEQANNKAGDFDVKYTSLNDATAQAGQWEAGQCAKDARTTVGDPDAVYYIGEFNSGCSEVSIPILNQGGIAQVSPANTYVGLTQSTPPALPDEPDKYYPTGDRTYMRIVPTDTEQAAADLQAMQDAGCTKVGVANDKEAYGAGLAKLIELEQGNFDNITVTSNTGIDPEQPNFRSYASTIKGEGADCFFFAGIPSNGATQIAKDVNAAIPDAHIFGGDGVCSTSFTSEKDGGVPASLAPLVQCTVATRDLSTYPGGKEFLKAYEDKYGVSDPDPYAIYGYEAMKLGLDTIAGLGDQGSDKAAVLQALLDTKDRKSVLGTYGFDENGDTTLGSWGLYGVNKDGSLKYVKTITPTSEQTTVSG